MVCMVVKSRHQATGGTQAHPKEGHICAPHNPPYALWMLMLVSSS